MGYRNIHRIPPREWIDIAEAVFLFSGIRIMVLFFPLKRYQNILGKLNVTPSEIDLSENNLIIVRVAKALVRARKIIRWQNNCLSEAIAAKIMLRKRNVASTLFLGVNKNQDSLKAHAWLCCGSRFITGKKGYNQFVVVSTFS